GLDSPARGCAADGATSSAMGVRNVSEAGSSCHTPTFLAPRGSGAGRTDSHGQLERSAMANVLAALQSTPDVYGVSQTIKAPQRGGCAVAESAEVGARHAFC